MAENKHPFERINEDLKRIESLIDQQLCALKTNLLYWSIFRAFNNHDMYLETCVKLPSGLKEDSLENMEKPFDQRLTNALDSARAYCKGQISLEDWEARSHGNR